jgi:hypothetical protein
LGLAKLAIRTFMYDMYGSTHVKQKTKELRETKEFRELANKA